MNIVLQDPRGGWYIAGVGKEHGEVWVVRGKALSDSGQFCDICCRTTWPTREKAEKACRKLAKRKVSGKGMTRVDVEELPDEAFWHLEPDPDNWVSPSEMVNLVRQSRRERYVYFSDVTGIEAFFQVNVEYIAYTTDDEEILEVIDKYGNLRNCLVSRFYRIENTEMTEQALKIS